MPARAVGGGDRRAVALAGNESGQHGRIAWRGSGKRIADAYQPGVAPAAGEKYPDRGRQRGVVSVAAPLFEQRVEVLDPGKRHRHVAQVFDIFRFTTEAGMPVSSGIHNDPAGAAQAFEHLLGKRARFAPHQADEDRDVGAWRVGTRGRRCRGDGEAEHGVRITLLRSRSLRRTAPVLPLRRRRRPWRRAKGRCISAG